MPKSNTKRRNGKFKAYNPDKAPYERGIGFIFAVLARFNA